MGCILVELLTGDALFQTHENLEHLAMMEAVVGPMPAVMAATAAAGPGTATLFKRGKRLNWPEGAEGKRSLRAVDKIRPLRDHLEAHGDDSLRPHLDTLVDLIGRLMEWEPAKRCTAAEALQHPFFAAEI